MWSVPTRWSQQRQGTTTGSSGGELSRQGRRPSRASSLQCIRCACAAGVQRPAAHRTMMPVEAKVRAAVSANSAMPASIPVSLTAFGSATMPAPTAVVTRLATPPRVLQPPPAHGGCASAAASPPPPPPPGAWCCSSGWRSSGTKGSPPSSICDGMAALAECPSGRACTSLRSARRCLTAPIDHAAACGLAENTVGRPQHSPQLWVSHWRHTETHCLATWPLVIPSFIGAVESKTGRSRGTSDHPCAAATTLAPPLPAAVVASAAVARRSSESERAHTGARLTLAKMPLLRNPRHSRSRSAPAPAPLPSPGCRAPLPTLSAAEAYS